MSLTRFSFTPFMYRCGVNRTCVPTPITNAHFLNAFADCSRRVYTRRINPLIRFEIYESRHALISLLLKYYPRSLHMYYHSLIQIHPYTPIYKEYTQLYVYTIHQVSGDSGVHSYISKSLPKRYLQLRVHRLMSTLDPGPSRIYPCDDPAAYSYLQYNIKCPRC